MSLGATLLVFFTTLQFFGATLPLPEDADKTPRLPSNIHLQQHLPPDPIDEGAFALHRSSRHPRQIDIPTRTK